MNEPKKIRGNGGHMGETCVFAWLELDNGRAPDAELVGTTGRHDWHMLVLHTQHSLGVEMREYRRKNAIYFPGPLAKVGGFYVVVGDVPRGQMLVRYAQTDELIAEVEW